MDEWLAVLITAYVFCTFIAFTMFCHDYDKDLGFIVWWPIYFMRWMFRTFIDAWSK